MSLLSRMIMDQIPELPKNWHSNQVWLTSTKCSEYPWEIIAATAETTPERKLALNLQKANSALQPGHASGSLQKNPCGTASLFEDKLRHYE